MFASQSNTQSGPRKFVAAADLTGLEGRLMVIANSGGVNQVTPVAALTDVPLTVLVDAGISGANVTVEQLSPAQNVRIKLKSTCVAGDKLVLADPATPADAGKVRKLPATGGVYVQVGVAEETGADGQLVLTRPHVEVIVVPTAVAITSVQNATAAATDLATSEALANALKTNYNALQVDVAALRTALIAAGITS